MHIPWRHEGQKEDNTKDQAIVVVETEEPAIPLKRDANGRRILGLRLRWVLVGSSFALITIVVLSAVLATRFHRRRTASLTPTGHYPTDAPFQEVLRSNFPDPSLFEHNGTWFAFATNSAAGILHSNISGSVNDLGAANVQVATSTDFTNWSLHDAAGDPLPVLGDWVANGTMRAEADRSTFVRRANIWAPDVLKRPDGKFVLYYAAAASNATPIHCVGAAISDDPQGPYDPLPTPLACPTDSGGAIDPSSIIDTDGTIYVAYKVDGNAKGNGGDCGNTIPPITNTPILLQKMADDGVTASGPPITILDRSDDDGPLVEAPALVRTDAGIYFLFFSSGCTRLPTYDLKYATSANITGPYTRASEILLKTGSMGLLAPGSASVWRESSTWGMAFHARVNTDLGGIRAMYTSNLLLNGTTATLQASTV